MFIRICLSAGKNSRFPALVANEGKKKHPFSLNRQTNEYLVADDLTNLSDRPYQS